MLARPGPLVLMASLALSACGDDPSGSASSGGSEGGRTSMAGRAMDRAEDLKKEVDAYNRTIEDTIAQGTGDAPPSGAKAPSPKSGQGSSPKPNPSSKPSGVP